ncbi:LysR family transcriptional regulator YbhD [Klebsiella michiganensis]|uniref:LysR family transcriptional regulator YbhD n=1 Tax=Klebsiella michiganensis TaxID=1134687 RepID=A0A7H4N7Z1_9ENTR|nr:LysR family transcriptional regulator YbhD [Klebsiella michiganensis]
MKNELSGMKAFVTVAELGSFSKAAEQLSLSQPALTKKIKKIESHLNIALFERTTAKTCAYPGRKNTAPQGQSVDFQS